MDYLNMIDRPLTDYLINVLNKNNETPDTSSILLDITTEDIMEENAREFASALNFLLGRVAINEDDIMIIIEQAKKDAGLR